MNLNEAKPFQFVAPVVPGNQSPQELSVEPEEKSASAQMVTHAAVSTIITITQSLFGKHIRLLMVTGNTASVDVQKKRFQDAMLGATMGDVTALLELFTFLSSLNLTLKD